MKQDFLCVAFMFGLLIAIKNFDDSVLFYVNLIWANTWLILAAVERKL